ncbi:dolichol-phosphate mannosyltransferase [Rhizomicrobium palustre]|uniref:Dolichol-phosphate mannosyltransferase n=1 Tax=Rhizomicrobium palustre TaxID=189966 RepID=A0A846MUR5_9PROT|nr:glycosyltransferase family 2 protein [Rhizomicrobium palustre]NIK87258.1 dolichol-phosphate mannosyltransferase [Rhizomicrobium palustre]
MALRYSVVVPVKDEAGNIAPLAREIAAAMAGLGDYEMIFVDDGSTDSTPDELLALKGEIRTLRVIRHATNLGQSRGVRTGVRAAKGEIIVTLDGDGQNDPADIPKLLAEFTAAKARGDESLGLVGGVRAKRKDTASRRLASRLANKIRDALLNDGAKDSGCGLKAFKREAFLALPYFDHLHRFLITMMIREGFTVGFVDVNHRPRLHGQSKYTNFHRMLVGIDDLMGVRWLQRRMRKKTEAKEL